MKPIRLRLIGVYRWLLHWYPPEFRDEFADEMQRVFADSLAEAAKRGSAAVMWICLKELRDLPGAILREHWRARSKAMLETNLRVSWRELLYTAIPFLLYLVFPNVKGLQIGWAGAVILLIPVVLIISLIVGLFKGIPRWSLPAFGSLLAILNYILFSLKDPNFSPFASLSPFFRQLFGAGFPFVGIIVLTLMIILVTAIIKPLHSFFQRIRDDCTLLPFALFGIMPFVIFISFDEYQGDVLYQIGMGLVLLISLWLYLQSTQPGRKLLILAIGITLAMAIEVVGKWIIVPSQNWGIWFQWHTVEQAMQIEVTSTIFTGFWVLIIVFLPALLGLLPRSTRLIPATQP